MLKVVAIALVLLAMAPQALAGCKTVWRGTKSYLKCTGDIAEAAGKVTGAAQDLKEAVVEKPLKAVGKGLSDIGKQTEKELSEAGRNINKGAIHLEKELEKTGQSLGNLLKKATNFSPSCEYATAVPSGLEPPYDTYCSGARDRWKRDAQACQAAGGASMIAAGVAASLESFGVSLALAKAAFEICEVSCRSASKFDSCMKGVDTAAAREADKAGTLTQKTKVEAVRAALLSCRYDALNRELNWRYLQTIEQCEKASDCHPADKASESWILARNKPIFEEIQKRKAAADVAYETGTELLVADYGPNIAKGAKVTAVLTNKVVNKQPSGMTCASTDMSVTFWTRLVGKSGQTVRHRWLYGDAIQHQAAHVLTREFQIEGDSWRVWSTIQLNPSKPGRWTVALVDERDQVLASYIFLALPPSSR